MASFGGLALSFFVSKEPHKAIYIRLADMVYPDGNTIKASAGLCHYANYERLCD